MGRRPDCLGTSHELGLGLEGVPGTQGETQDRGQQPTRTWACWEARSGESTS